MLIEVMNEYRVARFLRPMLLILLWIISAPSTIHCSSTPCFWENEWFDWCNIVSINFSKIHLICVTSVPLRIPAWTSKHQTTTSNQSQHPVTFAHTERYDSVCLTCSKKLTGSQLSPPHGTNKKLKCETKNKMMSVIGPVQSRYREAVQ